MKLKVIKWADFNFDNDEDDQSDVTTPRGTSRATESGSGHRKDTIRVSEIAKLFRPCL